MAVPLYATSRDLDKNLEPAATARKDVSRWTRPRRSYIIKHAVAGRLLWRAAEPAFGSDSPPPCIHEQRILLPIPASHSAACMEKILSMSDSRKGFVSPSALSGHIKTTPPPLLLLRPSPTLQHRSQLGARLAPRFALVRVTPSLRLLTSIVQASLPSTSITLPFPYLVPLPSTRLPICSLCISSSPLPLRLWLSMSLDGTMVMAMVMAMAMAKARQPP